MTWKHTGMPRRQILQLIDTQNFTALAAWAFVAQSPSHWIAEPLSMKSAGSTLASTFLAQAAKALRRQSLFSLLISAHIKIARSIDAARAKINSLSSQWNTPSINFPRVGHLSMPSSMNFSSFFLKWILSFWACSVFKTRIQRRLLVRTDTSILFMKLTFFRHVVSVAQANKKRCASQKLTGSTQRQPLFFLLISPLLFEIKTLKKPVL